MSGYKRATITITRDEYDKLRDMEYRLRTVPEVPTPVQAAILQQSSDAIQEQVDTTALRQQLYEDVLASLNKDIRDHEVSTARAISQYEKEISLQNQQFAGNLWDHLQQALTEQQQYFEETLQETQQHNHAELVRLADDIDELRDEQRQKNRIAAEWLSAAFQVASFIQDAYAHDIFTPGKLSKIRRALDQAARNLDTGYAEAVIAIAQQAFFDLSDLRVELEGLQSEWNLYVQATWETAQSILAYIVESEFIIAIDLEGQPLPYEISVDYWTKGKLTELIDRVNDIVDQIRNADFSLPVPQLKEWLEVELPGLYQSLEQNLEDARINALNSQLRINIAELVVRALYAQGFQVMNHQYDAEDERQAFQTRLSNLDGNEILVKVAPFGANIGDNELHIQSLDTANRTEHELTSRWKEISHSLAFYGLAVGPYSQEAGPQGAHRRKSGWVPGIPARKPMQTRPAGR